MRALVSGSHGFIGGHLCKRLEQLGCEVIRINRELIFSAIDELYIPGSYIFHLASYGNLYYQEDTTEMVRANVVNLHKFLMICAPFPYNVFVNMSTSSIYLPFPTMYSATKKAGEDIVHAYRTIYNKPVINIRPFTIVGPGEHAVHFIPKLIRSCLYGEPIYLNPYPVHDYIDVRDFVEILISIVIPLGVKIRIADYDIGSGKETSNKQILKIVEELTGKKVVLGSSDASEFDCAIRPYDIKKGWSAKSGYPREYVLKQTIADMIEYEKQRSKT